MPLGMIRPVDERPSPTPPPGTQKRSHFWSATTDEGLFTSLGGVSSVLLSRTQKSRLCLSGGLKLALRKAQYLSRLAGAG